MKKLFMFLLFTSIIFSQNIVTPEEAISIGLKNNFDILIAKNNNEIANNNLGKGTAGFLPTLDANGAYNYSSSDQTSNSPFSFGNSTTKGYEGRLSLNWTLFDGFKMFADNIRYKELSKLGDYQAKLIIENTMVNILAGYFNLVQQELLLEIAETSLKISEERLEKAKIRNSLGGASSSDLLNAQVSFNNDKSNKLDQELRTEIARKDLNILLAQDAETNIKVINKIDLPVFTKEYESLIESAKEKNNSLLIAIKNKEISESNIASLRADFYPRISLSANYGYSDREVNSDSERFTSAVTTQSKDASVALNFSFNIFNGLRDNIDVENAIIESKIRDLQLSNEENRITGLVREKFVTLQKRLEKIELEELNVTAAQQNLELQKERYETGTVNSLEFRDAQINLSRAQSDLVTAKFQARITILELQQLTGNIEILDK
jgi:outer membrane protein TolC